MSVNAASASARIASRSTTSMSRPMIFSTRTPALVSLRYGVLSLPSGNKGVWRYGGTIWAGAFIWIPTFVQTNACRFNRASLPSFEVFQVA